MSSCRHASLQVTLPEEMSVTHSVLPVLSVWSSRFVGSGTFLKKNFGLQRRHYLHDLMCRMKIKISIYNILKSSLEIMFSFLMLYDYNTKAGILLWIVKWAILTSVLLFLKRNVRKCCKLFFSSFFKKSFNLWKVAVIGSQTDCKEWQGARGCPGIKKRRVFHFLNKYLLIACLSVLLN